MLVPSIYNPIFQLMKRIRKEKCNKVEILNKLYQIYNYSNSSSESSFPTITSAPLT